MFGPNIVAPSQFERILQTTTVYRGLDVQLVVQPLYLSAAHSGTPLGIDQPETSEGRLSRSSGAVSLSGPV